MGAERATPTNPQVYSFSGVNSTCYQYKIPRGTPQQHSTAVLSRRATQFMNTVETVKLPAAAAAAA